MSKIVEFVWAEDESAQVKCSCGTYLIVNTEPTTCPGCGQVYRFLSGVYPVDELPAKRIAELEAELEKNRAEIRSYHRELLYAKAKIVQCRKALMYAQEHGFTLKNHSEFGELFQEAMED